RRLPGQCHHTARTPFRISIRAVEIRRRYCRSLRNDCGPVACTPESTSSRHIRVIEWRCKERVKPQLPAPSLGFIWWKSSYIPCMETALEKKDSSPLRPWSVAAAAVLALLPFPAGRYSMAAQD